MVLYNSDDAIGIFLLVPRFVLIYLKDVRNKALFIFFFKFEVNLKK